MDCWTFYSRNIQVHFSLFSDTSNHCENRETAYSRSDIVVCPVFIAAAQLRNDSTIYHNLVNLFMIFTCYHAVLFSINFKEKERLSFSGQLDFQEQHKSTTVHLSAQRC